MNRHLLLALIVLWCVPLIAELIARRWIPRLPEWHETKVWPDEFYAEIKQANSAMLDPSGLLLPGDSHGQYYNVTNGLRRTTDQPTGVTRTLYIFGNSTVFNPYLPDRFTLPSQLQRLISTYRVVNMGYNGATALIELTRLRSVVLQPGDVVVFYDGPSDIEGVYIDANRERKDHICQSVLETYRYLALSRLLCDWVRYPNRESLDVEGAVRRFAQVISTADGYTKAHGATFYHLLQPYLYTVSLSPEEQAMDANNPIWGMADLYTEMWSKLTTGDAIDVSHALDTPRLEGEELYADRVHLTAEGNRLMAQAIYDVLFPIL